MAVIPNISGSCSTFSGVTYPVSDDPIHFNRQIIPGILPENLNIRHVEQVLRGNWFTARQGHNGDTSGNILVFTLPVGNPVLTGTPHKVTENGNFG